MGIDYVNGYDATGNRYLAEALDMTREGSVPPGGTHGYDDVQYPHDDRVRTNRDSCLFGAIESLRRIEAASPESRAEIDRVLEMMRAASRAPNHERAAVMAEAHRILQDVRVPPTE